MALKLECGYLKGFIGEHEYAAMASQVENAHALLASGKGPGNDFLGWVDLPTNYDKEEFARIKAAAERIKKNTDVFIVIGIGGSYLGARAAIEFLKSEHYNALKKDRVKPRCGKTPCGSCLARISVRKALCRLQVHDREF